MENLSSYFQTRMEAFGNYSSIVWSRFNWFLTIQAGLVGCLINIHLNPAFVLNNLKIVNLLGLSISLIWFLLGFEDKRSLERHKLRLDIIESALLEQIQNPSLEKIQKVLEDKSHKDNQEKNYKFKQSSLLFIFPITISIAWLYFLVK